MVLIATRSWACNARMVAGTSAGCTVTDRLGLKSATEASQRRWPLGLLNFERRICWRDWHQPSCTQNDLRDAAESLFIDCFNTAITSLLIVLTALCQPLHAAVSVGLALSTRSLMDSQIDDTFCKSVRRSVFSIEIGADLARAKDAIKREDLSGKGKALQLLWVPGHNTKRLIIFERNAFCCRWGKR